MAAKFAKLLELLRREAEDPEAESRRVLPCLPSNVAFWTVATLTAMQRFRRYRGISRPSRTL